MDTANKNGPKSLVRVAVTAAPVNPQQNLKQSDQSSNTFTNAQTISITMTDQIALSLHKLPQTRTPHTPATQSD